MAEENSEPNKNEEIFKATDPGNAEVESEDSPKYADEESSYKQT